MAAELGGRVGAGADEFPQGHLREARQGERALRMVLDSIS